MDIRVQLVGPIEGGIRATLLIGTIDFVRIRGVDQIRYIHPDLREWQSYLDAGWRVEEYEHAL